MPGRTLDYWFDVEALTAPVVEDANDVGPYHFVTYVHDEEHPWHADHRRAHLRHKHFVRFGLIPRADYEAELLDLLHSGRAYNPETTTAPPGNALTYLGVFEVDHDGGPVQDSLMMAAFAIAYARLAGMTAVSFRAYCAELIDYFNHEAGVLREGDQLTDHVFIDNLKCRALGLLDWSPPGMDAAPHSAVVSHATVHLDGKSKDKQLDPVNGFYLDDIDEVRRSVQNGPAPNLVLSMLADPAAVDRRDCTRPEMLWRTVAIGRMPDGRWPAAHPMALMQQVAVNEALDGLRHGGLFSVNGPPGTGKTTLLMDMAAALIVARAKKLATPAAAPIG